MNNATRPIHEIEASGRESQRVSVVFRQDLVHVKTLHKRPLCRRNRTSITKDIHHRRAYFDILRASKDLMHNLGQVDVKSNLPFQ